MIAYLQKLKERCASCKDPEKEIVQNMWRLMLTVFFFFHLVIIELNECQTFPLMLNQLPIYKEEEFFFKLCFSFHLVI